MRPVKTLKAGASSTIKGLEALWAGQTAVVILTVLAVLSSPALAGAKSRDSLVYSVQVESFNSLDRAEKNFDRIRRDLPPEKCDHLRIEHIPPHYVIRIGKLDNHTAAADYFRSISDYFPGTLVQRVSFEQWRFKKLMVYGKDGRQKLVVPEPSRESTVAGVKTANPKQQAAAQPSLLRNQGSNLISINFIDVDIRSALSALAIEQEINIASSQEVGGNISVHLNKVTLDQALEAITMAGGFEYKKNKGLYWVYKPKLAKEPQSDRLELKIFRLKYAQVEKIQEILDAIPGLRLSKIHESTKTIIVEDTPENIKKIERIISHWDVLPRQVWIEAKILEIALTDDMAMGVNWATVLGDYSLGTGSFSTGVMPNVQGGSPVPPTGIGFFGSIITGTGSGDLRAAIDALRTKTNVETLSTPKILVIHGKSAKVQVGGKQGYKVSVISEGVVNENIKFIDTGTILEITSYIDAENNVLLNVTPSINSARIEEGIPVVNTTVVSTWIMAKSGETALIGGLIQDTKTKRSEAVPCLGNIPGLGLLFGRKATGTGKSELVILITPTVLDSKVRRPTPEAEEALEKVKKTEERLKEQSID